MEGDRRI